MQPFKFGAVAIFCRSLWAFSSGANGWI